MGVLYDVTHVKVEVAQNPNLEYDISTYYCGFTMSFVHGAISKTKRVALVHYPSKGAKWAHIEN
jgi:hypothetical protein